MENPRKRAHLKSSIKIRKEGSQNESPLLISIKNLFCRLGYVFSPQHLLLNVRFIKNNWGNLYLIERLFLFEVIYFMRLTQPTKGLLNFENVGWVMFFQPNIFFKYLVY